MTANNKAPDEIRAHMRRVPLSIPAVAGGEVIHEVFLRRPTAAYLQARESLAADGDDENAANFAAVAMATGLTVAEVKDLDLDDFVMISEEISDFFGEMASQRATPPPGEQS